MAAGYRDAECGWVMVGEENHHHEEELPKSSLRTALFLVIYATKRGILEVTIFFKISELTVIEFCSAIKRSINLNPKEYCNLLKSQHYGWLGLT